MNIEEIEKKLNDRKEKPELKLLELLSNHTKTDFYKGLYDTMLTKGYLTDKQDRCLSETLISLEIDSEGLCFKKVVEVLHNKPVKPKKTTFGNKPKPKIILMDFE